MSALLSCLARQSTLPEPALPSPSPPPPSGPNAPAPASPPPASPLSVGLAPLPALPVAAAPAAPQLPPIAASAQWPSFAGVAFEQPLASSKASSVDEARLRFDFSTNDP